jgi:hypothetical protein
MHTDAHATELLLHELGLNVSDANSQERAVFDIENIPLAQQLQALSLLRQPEYTGCGHIRLMLQHPDEYVMALHACGIVAMALNVVGG